MNLIDTWKPGLSPHFTKVMKLTFFFLTAVFLQVSASSSGQTVTYSGKDVRLQTVFNAIEQQTGYGFFYNDSDLKKAFSVTVELVNTPLQEALQIILRGQPITYSISGKTIAITKPQPVVVNMPEPMAPPSAGAPLIDVSGHIVDEKGQPVVATVTVKGTSVGTRVVTVLYTTPAAVFWIPEAEARWSPV